MSQLQEQLDDANETIADLESELDNARDEIDTLQDEIDSLENELETAREEAYKEGYDQALADAKAAIENLE